MFSSKETAQFIDEYWPKKSGLAAAEIISFLALSTLLVAINVSLLLWACIILLVGISIFFLWPYTSRPPVVSKDKIGFLVCITCSDEKELSIIVEDFISPLRQLVKSGKVGDSFYFVKPAIFF